MMADSYGHPVVGPLYAPEKIVDFVIRMNNDNLRAVTGDDLFMVRALMERGMRAMVAENGLEVLTSRLGVQE